MGDCVICIHLISNNNKFGSLSILVTNSNGLNKSQKIDNLLNCVHLSFGRPTSHAQTVNDVRENVGLDDGFEHVTGKVVPESVQ